MAPPEALDDQTELDALRLENDTLRRNLGRLEEKVKRAEENVLHQQEQAKSFQEADYKQLGQCTGEGPNTMQGCSAPLEVCHLHGILQWLHKAKADMVDNDRSKLQLERDVRLLFNLLERAKKERRSYEVTIRQLDRSVDASNARVVELEEELQLQRRSFTRVLRSDRDVYEARTQAAHSVADRRGRQLKRVMNWVEKADFKFAEALGKLSAQAEEVGAANLGDLDGFAKEMSAEVDKLRQGVAESLRSKSKGKPPRRGNAIRKGKKTRKAKARAKTKAQDRPSDSPYSGLSTASTTTDDDSRAWEVVGQAGLLTGGLECVEERSSQSDTIEQPK